jgi:hypothetical protein
MLITVYSLLMTVFARKAFKNAVERSTLTNQVAKLCGVMVPIAAYRRTRLGKFDRLLP